MYVLFVFVLLMFFLSLLYCLCFCFSFSLVFVLNFLLWFSLAFCSGNPDDFTMGLSMTGDGVMRCVDALIPCFPLDCNFAIYIAPEDVHISLNRAFFEMHFFPINDYHFYIACISSKKKIQTFAIVVYLQVYSWSNVTNFSF